MFLLNSCLSLFSAAHLRGHPFSRSYGVILPSSLTMLLPPALGFSPHPPVSVYGTGAWQTIAAFLDRRGTCFATSFRSTSRLRLMHSGFACCATTPFVPDFPFPAHVSLPCPHSSVTMRYRNINLLSIGYAFQPDLRSRLSQADQLYPGDLGYSATRILTLFSLLIPAFSLLNAPQLLTVLLHRPKNAPLPMTTSFPGFGGMF